MSKTHWKNNFDYQYLGGYSIDGDDLELTIVEVKNEDVEGQKGQKESCMVIYFEEVDKGMICNKTNAKMIQSLYGSPYLEDWVGKKIILGTEPVTAFGETTDALRIRAYKPKVQIDPTKAIAKIKGALDISDLQTIWKSLSKDEQNNKEIINIKNTMKNELS